eukprot:1142799-Pelagomonas_calceolata.AAC.2
MRAHFIKQDLAFLPKVRFVCKQAPTHQPERQPRHATSKWRRARVSRMGIHHMQSAMQIQTQTHCTNSIRAHATTDLGLFSYTLQAVGCVAAHVVTRLQQIMQQHEGCAAAGLAAHHLVASACATVFVGGAQGHKDA